MAGEDSQPALSKCKRSIEAYGGGENSINVSSKEDDIQKIVTTRIKEELSKASA